MLKDNLAKCREDYKKVINQYDEYMNAEKEHFKRVQDFEAACDKNDEMRQKLGL